MSNIKKSLQSVSTLDTINLICNSTFSHIEKWEAKGLVEYVMGLDKKRCFNSYIKMYIGQKMIKKKNLLNNVRVSSL